MGKCRGTAGIIKRRRRGRELRSLLRYRRRRLGTNMK
jgi:hypothetical protein